MESVVNVGVVLVAAVVMTCLEYLHKRVIEGKLKLSQAVVKSFGFALLMVLFVLCIGSAAAEFKYAGVESSVAAVALAVALFGAMFVLLVYVKPLIYRKWRTSGKLEVK